MIVIMMGVTGTGKSTIAKALATTAGWEFAEGDDYHSDANVQKMRAGVPLTDGDREPWLAALHDILEVWQAEQKSGVMTCSALKEKYRVTLSEGLGQVSLHFVLLDVPKQVLVDRLDHRPGHFMNPALLDSQLATLEITPDLVRINADQAPAATVEQILQQLGVTADSPRKGT